MAIGVFGLQVAYRLKRLEVMSLDDTYGWFAGGFTSGPVVFSTVNRIDFSNDTGTANIRGSLSVGRERFAATGNSNYGWFGGGYALIPAATTSTSVDRIDFSNDSSTASVRGSLSGAKQQLAATGNSNYGWFGGGVPTVSRVDRIDFSNDSSTASPRGPLSIEKQDLAATGNSNYGWFCGGKQAPGPSKFSRVDRIDFSNDSPTVSVRGPLSAARAYLAATGNSNYGWFGAGDFPLVSIVDRIDFSNDSSTALIRGSLTSARYKLAATGNSNYGWFGVGSFTVSIVDRIDFSNDSVTSSVRGSLSVSRRSYAAVSGQAKGPAIKLAKTLGYGWFGGGVIPTPAIVATVDRIDFSNDSATASPRGPLILARSGLAATGNSNYGWFGGGISPTPATVSTVDRINFSNDNAIALSRGSLYTEIYSSAAIGNSNYGWFIGGFNPLLADSFGASTSIVSRIDFSNDSLNTEIRGPAINLTSGIIYHAATGNFNYGWFVGATNNGASNRTVVNRIDFSNDYQIAIERGPLNIARSRLAATGNSNYGWFGGGISPTPAIISTVDRIDFSNDSATASIRGPLSSAKYFPTATGNSNYGWFGGGRSQISPTIDTSIIDRIDFSNDSSTASPRGPLNAPAGRSSLAATSNTPIG